MTDNEFMLFDRLEKIKSVIMKYGEEKFYISFSGGKDSVVLSHLIDMAIPDNKIPRVYCNTGIEFQLMVSYVKGLQMNDERIIIIQPKQNIKEMLENKGYPFKSKRHSKFLSIYQNQKGIENSKTLKHYLNVSNDGVQWSSWKLCPKMLQYQFDNSFDIKVSDKCCLELKEKPLHEYSKNNNKPFAIIGLMREEGGRRETAHCLAFRNNKLFAFQPLAAVSKDWENWYIKEYNIKLCPLYYPPYNFERTGCKGCPFNIKLQEELNTLEKFFPNEKKQCEIIWKPVYTEYRRINYRLKEGETK